MLFVEDGRKNYQRKTKHCVLVFVKERWSNIVEKIRKKNSHKRDLAKDYDVDS